MDTIPNGVLPDFRSDEEKEKDHLHEDLFGGLPVTWVERLRSSWRVAKQRNQDGSFSCVKQASATAMEKLLPGNVISAAGYKLRAGKSQGGMYLQNCGDIDKNQGTVLEATTPSQNMNDPQMDAIVLPTLNIQITGYRTFTSINIDSIAEAVQAYGNCIMIFHSNALEWELTPKFLNVLSNFGHAICATDFTLINGVKTLVCMDSAGQFSSPTGLRLITEDFLNHRCVGAMYYTGIKTIDQTLSPKLTLSVWQKAVKILVDLGIISN